ncbi:MAG TPA: hypothetical protein VH413_04410 [Verrucomicrobiae bacterium]|jgi:hypothetical protein|nr:hypothetical protein [Verrucomicrobiae bacterium]
MSEKTPSKLQTLGKVTLIIGLLLIPFLAIPFLVKLPYPLGIFLTGGYSILALLYIVITLTKAGQRSGDH